jgi:hypothetical protein
MVKKGEKGKSKIKIKELKPKIKEIKNEEETLDEEIIEADEEIFNDLDSMQTGPSEADSLGASRARVPLSDIASSGPSNTFQSNPNEEMSFAHLYSAGFGMGDARKTPYNPNAVSSSPTTLARRDIGDFGMQQGHSFAEESALDQTSARLRHQDVGGENDKYSSSDLDKQEGKKGRYWV